MIPKERPRNPAIPGTVKDRTATGGIVRRASAAIRQRFAGLQAEVLAIFGRIRTYQGNDLAPKAERTLYALTPEELAATSQALQDALERWIADGKQPAHLLWYQTHSAEAAQLGTAQSVANLANLSATYAAARSLEQVIYSEPYRNRVAMAQIRNMDHWTGLSGTLRSELSQIIGRAVADGKNPVDVRTEIAERLDVSRSKALQYAQTDITDTLRQARMQEMEMAQEQFAMNLGLLWTSALIPTTRQWHASRSGKVYTPAEVREFYGQRGNRYNCRCAVTECLIDDNNRPVLTDSLKRKMAAEREAWQRANPDA